MRHNVFNVYCVAAAAAPACVNGAGAGDRTAALDLGRGRQRGLLKVHIGTDRLNGGLVRPPLSIVGADLGIRPNLLQIRGVLIELLESLRLPAAVDLGLGLFVLLDHESTETLD